MSVNIYLWIFYFQLANVASPYILYSTYVNIAQPKIQLFLVIENTFEPVGSLGSSGNNIECHGGQF